MYVCHAITTLWTDFHVYLCICVVFIFVWSFLTLLKMVYMQGWQIRRLLRFYWISTFHNKTYHTYQVIPFLFSVLNSQTILLHLMLNGKYNPNMEEPSAMMNNHCTSHLRPVCLQDACLFTPPLKDALSKAGGGTRLHITVVMKFSGLNHSIVVWEPLPLCSWFIISLTLQLHIIDWQQKQVWWQYFTARTLIK